MTRARFAQTALVLGLLACTTGCGEPFEAPLPPRDQMNFPVGLAMHPEGRFLYAVNSDFNARFKSNAGGVVSVIDTETLEVESDRSPFIPSFGGFIQLNDDASKAYVTARQGNSLVAFDVAEGNGPNQPAGGALFCGDGSGGGSSDPGPCTIRRIPDDASGTELATDPFGLDVATLDAEHPETGEETAIDVVGLSYLSSNRASALSFPNRSRSGASIQTGSLLAGSNQVTKRPGTLNFYAAGRNTNQVAIFTPFVNLREAGSFGEVEALISLDTIRVSPASRSIDARGVAFNETGDRLYVSTRTPDALYIYDVVPSDAETGGGTEHRLAATVPIENNPSNVVVHRTPGGRPLVYVLSFQEQTIQVIDPQSATVIDTIALDASPYDMVVDAADDRCRSPGEPCRGYVSLFDDTPKRSGDCDPEGSLCGSIGVVDLDPESARYHQLVTKIH